MGLYKQKFNPVSSQFDLVISEADFNSKADLSYVDAQGKNLILNAMLNAFRIAQIGALTILKMVDGFMDEYEDESGINLPSSSGFFYDAVNDFFKPEVAIDSFTKLLLHLDGVEGATSDTDLSPSSHTVVFDVAAHLSTAQSEFGTASLYLPGESGSNLDIQGTQSDWGFGTNDFTFESWVRFPVVGNCNLFTCVGGGGAYQLYFNSSAMVLTTSNGTITGPAWSLSPNTWYHFTCVQSSGNILFFLNGVTSPNQGGAIVGGISSPVADLLVGGNNSTGIAVYMDEVRVSSLARWSSNFTPDASPYGVANNMTLISNSQIAQNVPTQARIILFEEDIDVIILNTDFQVYVSRDNGVTYSQATLEDEGNYITEARILSALVDISGQPSGSNIIYKLMTLNGKNLKVHGTAISWK